MHLPPRAIRNLPPGKVMSSVMSVMFTEEGVPSPLNACPLATDPSARGVVAHILLDVGSMSGWYASY